jgi:hypothetical protein
MRTEHYERCFAQQDKSRDRQPLGQPGPADGKENRKRRKRFSNFRTEPVISMLEPSEDIPALLVCIYSL